MSILSRTAPSTTSISDFDSGHGWAKTSPTGTWADDTGTSSPNASQTLKVTTDGAGSNTFGDLTLGADLDLTGQFPVLWVMIDDASKLNTIELFVDDNTGNFSNYHRLTVGSQSVRLDNTWTVIPVSFSLDNPAGSPDRSAIDKIRLRVSDDATGAINVWLGGLHYSAENDTGYVTHEFDDGRDGVYLNAYPILAAAGMVGTVGVIPDLVGTAGYMTEAQLQELVSAGWTVSVHHQTVMSGQTVQQVTDQVNGVKAWINQRGWTGSGNVVYPGGQYDANVLTALSPIALTGRTTTEAPMPGTGLFEPYQISVELPVNTTTTTHVNDQITAAKTNKDWLRIAWHDILTAPETATVSTQYMDTDFQTIITHQVSEGVASKTVSEMVGDAGPRTRTRRRGRRRFW